MNELGDVVDRLFCLGQQRVVRLKDVKHARPDLELHLDAVGLGLFRHTQTVVAIGELSDGSWWSDSADVVVTSFNTGRGTIRNDNMHNRTLAQRLTTQGNWIVDTLPFVESGGPPILVFSRKH